MREIKYVSLRAKYERRVFIIYTILKIASLIFAIVGMLSLLTFAISQLYSVILNDNIINILGILGFCTLMISPITIISATLYYESAEDYGKYLEKKNKKWLI